VEFPHGAHGQVHQARPRGRGARRLSNFAPQSEQSHTLFLVVDTHRFNFGIGRGLTGASDRWTVKGIISF
jgi:hypothetical protein